MLDPKDITLVDQQGKEHHYRLGKMPYLSGGREVCTQFMSTAAPKIGDYERNEALSLKMMQHVAVIIDGNEIPLKTVDLVNNHIPDFVTGIKLEEAMLEHNLGFSILGKLQEYRKQWETTLPQLLTQILIPLREAFAKPTSARGKTSKPSTRSKTS